MPDLHLIHLCGANNSIWLFAPVSQAGITWARLNHPQPIILDVDSFVESVSNHNLRIEA